MGERKIIDCNIEENEKEDVEYYNNLLSYITKLYIEEVSKNE